MQRSTIEQLADRVGMAAYLFVMNGGREDWSRVYSDAAQAQQQADDAFVQVITPRGDAAAAKPHRRAQAGEY